MSNNLKMLIQRVNALPPAGERIASTMYIVKSASDPDIAEIHFTNNDASATYRVVDRNDIRSMVQAVAGSTNAYEIVANIAARNALQALLTRNTMVLVIDATADSTVSVGTAMYVWSQSGQTWSKLTEFESLDVELRWENIIGRPNVTAAQLEDAVAKAHSHTNLPVLEKFTEVGGELRYAGDTIGGNASLTKADW